MNRMERCKICTKFSVLIKVLLFIFILGSLFTTLWVRSEIISTEYRLSNLEQQKKELLRERKLLIAEKASLTSFVKLDNAVQKEMVFPDRKKVVLIYGNPETLVQSVSYKKER